VTTPIPTSRRHEALGRANIPSSTLYRSSLRRHLRPLGGGNATCRSPPPMLNYPTFQEASPKAAIRSARLRSRLGRNWAGPAVNPDRARAHAMTQAVPWQPYGVATDINRGGGHKVETKSQGTCSSPTATMDDNVPQTYTIISSNALIKANMTRSASSPQRRTRDGPASEYTDPPSRTTRPATSQGTFHPPSTR